MKKTGKDTIWVGKFLSTEEFVVYDPAQQRTDQQNYVYLFDVAQIKIIRYERTAAHNLFVRAESSKATEFIIKIYHQWQARTSGRRKMRIAPSRSTHCWRCGADLKSAWDQSCPKCKWLRCECGACGCNFPYE